MARVKKILVAEDETVENQIIYTPESAALALDATIRVFPIPEAQLEMLTLPEKPNAWEVTAWKVREALDYDQYEVPRSSKNITFADLCELGRSLLPHRDSAEWIEFLRRSSFNLPKEFTCSLLTKNFNVAMAQAQGIDATAYRPARLLLTACGMAWSSKNEVIPGSFDLTFSRAKKVRRIVNLLDKVGKASPKIHKERFFALVMLGSVIRIQTQKMASGVSDIPKIMDSVRGILDNRPVPDGYKSIEHVVQEALITSFVYGFKVAPEKILSLNCIPIFPLTNRRMLFNSAMITPYYHAAKIAENLVKEVLRRQADVAASK